MKAEVVVLLEVQVEGVADTFPPESGSRGAGGHHMGWAGLGAVADHKAAIQKKKKSSHSTFSSRYTEFRLS